MNSSWGIRVGDWMLDEAAEMMFEVKSISSRVELGVTEFYAVDSEGGLHAYNDCRLLRRTGVKDWNQEAKRRNW